MRAVDARGRRWIGIAVGALVLASILHLTIGGTLALPVRDVLSSIAGRDMGLASAIVWKLRLPRLAAAIVAGAGLGAAGCVFQTLFRNPLAEPFVIGVSSGAGVGGTLAIATGLAAIGGGIVLAAAGAIGGIAALVLVMLLSGWNRNADVVRLLLSGVVIGALLGAATTLILLMSRNDTNVVLRWMLGSFTPMTWQKIGAMVFASSLAIWLGIARGRNLNTFAFGPDLAGRLGLDVKREAGLQLFAFTLATGVIVGCAGIIGFVGLIAPHIARSLVGPDIRKSLPVAFLIGSTTMVAADFFAQRLIAGAELPVGAITALIGSPVLLILLRRGIYRLAR